MLHLTLCIASVILTAAPAHTAADVVTLRDGKVILGQVLDVPPRGRIPVAIRREWAKANLPEKLRVWEASEARHARRAVDDRRRRLLAWRTDRVATENPDDPILTWITAELDRLDHLADHPSRLILVELDRSTIRNLIRRNDDEKRMLRQSWIGSIADSETRPVDDLKRLLEGRGFPQSEIDPASIDDLLPLPVESGNHWLARRAATEVRYDKGLKFVQHLGLLLPEDADAANLNIADVAGGAIKALLGEPQADPLVLKCREIAGRGKVGMVLTRLDLGNDLQAATVESTLFVRTGPDRWEPAIRRPATVRLDQVGDAQRQGIAADPQVKQVFKVFEGLGLGAAGDQLQQTGINVGAATRQALGQAQSALGADLDSLALPIGEPSRTK
jgi:hypothetical protein